MNLQTLKLIALAVVMAAVFGAGYAFRGIEVSALQAEHAQQMQAISAEAARKAQELQAEQERHVADVAAIDAKHYQELEDAKEEIDRLASDVVAGTRRLSISAKCPRITGVPEASTSASVGDAAGARLTEDAERNYWRLTSGIETVTKQLRACQDYAKSLQ